MIARLRYRRGFLLSLDEKTSCFELEVFDGMHDVYRSPIKMVSILKGSLLIFKIMKKFSHFCLGF